MDLILIAGPQAVGKMTVGHALENRIEANLLFNHETIDLFAKFLGYTTETFRLSEKVRQDLFKAFVNNPETNVTKGIIFTVVIGFDVKEDWEVLQQWSSQFLNAKGSVYFIELEADLQERLIRNTSEYRLKMKPSKRDTVFSENELIRSMGNHRLNSHEGEVLKKLPKVNYLRIDNSDLTADQTASIIVSWLDSKGYKQTTSPD